MTLTSKNIKTSISSLKFGVLALALSFGITACGGGSDGPQNYPTSQDSSSDYDSDEDSPGFMDILPIPGFGGDKDKIPGGKAPVLGVNTYLWRATLDTLSFMPMLSADPTGGVIISDWYADPQTPGERFKVTVYILDQRLRADGIRVSVFKQKKQGSSWADSAINPETPAQLEDAILTRARQLRVAQFDE